MPAVDLYYAFFLENIRSVKAILLTTPFANGHGEYIYPIECDRGVDISKEVEELFTKMAQKLRTMDKLQILSNASYGKLLMYLYSANEKSRRLNELLKQFRPICMETTKRQRKIFSAVQKETFILVRTCEQIEAETEALLDSMLLEHIGIPE